MSDSQWSQPEKLPLACEHYAWCITGKVDMLPTTVEIIRATLKADPPCRPKPDPNGELDADG